MVDWIKNKNGEARVRDAAGHEARVGVVEASPPYLRTYADGDWNDNLLALPRSWPDRPNGHERRRARLRFQCDGSGSAGPER